jgi:hypothetical protein
MSADIYYGIGSTHQVCQDFAIANGSYVIVSDGCSSVKDSDWGARLLAKATDSIMKRDKPVFIDDKHMAEIVTTARQHVTLLGLEMDCLCATLLAAYKSDGMINATIIGDGYIVARKKDKTICIISHMFDTGAPYYPYYESNPDIKNGYMKHFGHGCLEIRKTVYDGGGKFVDDCNNYSVRNADMHVNYSFLLEEYEAVAVVTDGLKTFVQQKKGSTSITNQSLDFYNVIKNIFSFKTTEGQFVHRRCQKVMREYANDSVKHTDDFAIGVVHV